MIDDCAAVNEIIHSLKNQVSALGLIYEKVDRNRAQLYRAQADVLDQLVALTQGRDAKLRAGHYQDQYNSHPVWGALVMKIKGNYSVEIFPTYDAAVDLRKELIENKDFVYAGVLALFAEPVLTSGLPHEVIYSSSPRFAYAFIYERRGEYRVDIFEDREQLEAAEQEFRTRAAHHFDNGDASCASCVVALPRNASPDLTRTSSR